MYIPRQKFPRTSFAVPSGSSAATTTRRLLLLSHSDHFASPRSVFGWLSCRHAGLAWNWGWMSLARLDNIAWISIPGMEWEGHVDTNIGRACTVPLTLDVPWELSFCPPAVITGDYCILLGPNVITTWREWLEAYLTIPSKYYCTY